MTGVVGLLRLRRRQNRVETLAGEVEQALARTPEWKTGKALLAVIDLERGRTEQARKAWQELLDDKQNPMPPIARYIIGQELENYGAMADLLLRTLEEGVDESLKDTDMEYSYHPVRRLVAVYRETGRKTESGHWR